MYIVYTFTVYITILCIVFCFTVVCYCNSMAFNHYAKIKTILQQQPSGWYIKRINEPTTAKTFSGETKQYTHYYRIYDYNGMAIKYCKFQQLDRLAATLQMSTPELPVIE